MIFPLADTTVPFGPMITQAANSWLLSNAGLFLAEGISWVTNMGKILIIAMGIKFALEIWAGGTGEGVIPFAAHRLGRWFLVMLMMRYYNGPMPYGGLSFHQLIPETARQLLIQTQNNSLKIALGTVEDVQKQADKETDWWSPSENFAATIIGWMVSLFNGVMLLLSSGGYVLMAIAVTVGPLSIPWLTFEWSSWLFWDWLQFLLSASMFQVIGAVLVNIWANVMVLAGPYFLSLSIDQMAYLFAALNIAIAISVISIPWIVSALYGKGASSAANIAQSITHAVR